MTTAIISALPEEQAGLAQLLQNKELLAQHPRALQRGLIHEKPVILALAGIGKVAAALTATMLIERHQVQRIIFTGVAGGLAPQVHVGDVVVGSAYLQHDMDASPLFPRYEIPLTGMSRFAAEPALFATILGAIKQDFMPTNSLKGFQNFQIHEGLIISGDRFVSSAAEVHSLRTQLPDALCVEMEGAAVAQVCHSYRLPFTAIRTISDRADDNAHVDFPQFVSEVAGPYAVGMVRAIMSAL